MTALTLAARLIADEPVLPTSPAAQIITVTAGGIAAILTALALVLGARKRRAAEAELVAPDPENNATRLRERLTTLEAWSVDARGHQLPDRVTRVETQQLEVCRRLEELEEQMSLRRAADVVLEGEVAPRNTRRRRPPP